MPNPDYQLNRGELARLQRLFAPNPETQCWEWTGPTTPNGYAKWQRGPGHRDRVAHRIVYEHYKRTNIPEELQLDHLCRTRNCINPDHMEIVTGSENTMRQDHAGRRKTECPQGHTYDEANTRITPAGKRVCRQCDRDRRKDSVTRVAGLEEKVSPALAGVQGGARDGGDKPVSQ
jgi:hypothetical protein